MTIKRKADESIVSDGSNDMPDKPHVIESVVTDNTNVIGTRIATPAPFNPPLFVLGRVAITSDVIDLLDRSGTNASDLLAQHQRGDWGIVGEDDAAENSRAISNSERIISVYELGEQHERVWIITDRDRSITLLMGERY